MNSIIIRSASCNKYTREVTMWQHNHAPMCDGDLYTMESHTHSTDIIIDYWLTMTRLWLMTILGSVCFLYNGPFHYLSPRWEQREQTQEKQTKKGQEKGRREKTTKKTKTTNNSISEGPMKGPKNKINTTTNFNANWIAKNKPKPNM